jgi:hypothetical protein
MQENGSSFLNARLWKVLKYFALFDFRRVYFVDF